MALTPVQLGTAAIAKDTIKADKAACKPFGPCGVGKAALYIGTYFIDRYYYIALDSVQRVFKRVAMSRGGFSGHGVFGAIPYLVVQYDNGSESSVPSSTRRMWMPCLAIWRRCAPVSPSTVRRRNGVLRKRLVRRRHATSRS